MSTTDLYADLIRRAGACEAKSRIDGARDLTAWVEGLHGQAHAYRHAAELLRGAVAAAVEEERAACAERAEAVCHEHGAAAGLFVADAIRARGESFRGDAASDGQ